LTEIRAPRFGQIEIPLTLTTENKKPLLCSCLNISSSGAFLCVLESEDTLHVGMTCHTKMLKRGKLIDIEVIIKRITPEGFGIRFIQESMS
jgi:hypothetical protein